MKTQTQAQKEIKRDLARLNERIAKLDRQRNEMEKEGDQEMVELYTDDATALRELHEAVSGGELEYAKLLTIDMDTAVRDEIPKRLYNTIWGGEDY